MNYEKKYKEALEKARQFSERPLQEDSSSIVEYIFPELKESEDERIRKELITHCRNTRCVTEEGAEGIAKWIAWLEKQGEPLSVDVDVETKDENAQDLIEKYVSDHANCRWLDASELEQLLNDFVLEYDKIKNREYEQQCKCKSK